MVQLRPFEREELAVLQRFATEPEAVGAFDWAGFGDPNQVIDRIEENGLLTSERSELAVVDQDQVVGAVQWLPGEYATFSGTPASSCRRVMARAMEKRSVTLDPTVAKAVDHHVEAGAAESFSAAINEAAAKWAANRDLREALDAVYADRPDARPPKEQIAAAAERLTAAADGAR